MQLSSIIITYLSQYSHEDEHYRKVVSAFLASHLISCAQYDDVLARLVEHHRNQYIIDLAVSLLLDPKVSVLSLLHMLQFINLLQISSSPQEFPSTLDALSQINAGSISAHNPKLANLLDIAKLRDNKKDKDISKEEVNILYNTLIHNLQQS